MEIWKEITWTDGRYYVSSEGRIKSVGGKRSKRKPTIMRTGIQNSGYESVKLFYESKHHTWLVHRLVALIFLGEKESMDVNHKNGNKRDNRVSNLEWCTRKENMEHCSTVGLRSDIKKVAALKNGKVEFAADYSRLLAVKMKKALEIDTSVETISRSIRKKIDTGSSYKGFTFIKIENL